MLRSQKHQLQLLTAGLLQGNYFDDFKGHQAKVSRILFGNTTLDDVLLFNTALYTLTIEDMVQATTLHAPSHKYDEINTIYATTIPDARFLEMLRSNLGERQTLEPYNSPHDTESSALDSQQGLNTPSTQDSEEGTDIPSVPEMT